ncbi:hypothetical protein [Winogradskyella immobilis]|uniref:hypothetical protein n=1 Tax=Winogradskyella immobilis TaxID=2816852 RepID=UPI001D0C5E68|nr:hypothetical protein [Winogradskyella immobilis]MCG0015376.1 hypothetical protein [Winogradskyella immobilis]
MKCVRIETVNKESIKSLQFPKEELLSSIAKRKERCNKLKRAMALGNLEQEKVKIIFIDNEGFKRVETTIWGVTDKNVILKESTLIPLGRIVSVA